MNGDHGEGGLSNPVVKKTDTTDEKVNEQEFVEIPRCDRHPKYNPTLGQPPWIPGLGQSICPGCWNAYYKIKYPNEPCGRSLEQCPYNKYDHLAYFNSYDEFGNPLRTHENHIQNPRKIRLSWTCSNAASGHHKHRWKWSAFLCGIFQKWGWLNFG